MSTFLVYFVTNLQVALLSLETPILEKMFLERSQNTSELGLRKFFTCTFLDLLNLNWHIVTNIETRELF